MNKLYKNEDGAVLPIVALLLTFVLIGLSALVVDVGFLYAERRSMVTAADAAALGGAKVLQEALSDPTAVQSAVESNAIKVATDLALANGVKNESDIEVKIELDTHYNSKVIKVKVKNNYQLFFARIFGSDTSDVSADAVAIWGNVTKLKGGDILPIFMIDTLYQSTDYAYLHADKFIDDTANGNWGFIDIYGSTSGIGDAFANQTLGLSMTLGSTIENQTGFNAGNIINPIEERMQKANLLPEKEDRIRYMSGLVPIIDWEHRIVQGAQIQLPIKYFAVFEIYDVIVSEAQNVNQKSQGSKYALYDKPDYKYDPNHLVAKEYDKVGGEALAKATIIGKFTGEIVDIIAVPQPGDQNPPIPGVISPTYALLIE